MEPGGQSSKVPRNTWLINSFAPPARLLLCSTVNPLITNRPTVIRNLERNHWEQKCIAQSQQMKSGIITWVCTNSPTAPDALCDCKSCVCMPNWLNNLEPITSHQEIKGAAQSDYSQIHLPQLYNVCALCITCPNPNT